MQIIVGIEVEVGFPRTPLRPQGQQHALSTDILVPIISIFTKGLCNTTLDPYLPKVYVIRR